jgi:hypothetical protein
MLKRHLGRNALAARAHQARAPYWSGCVAPVHCDRLREHSRISRSLAGAGFDILTARATYTCAATPRAKSEMYAVMARLWEQGEFVARAESLGAEVPQ